MKAEKRVRYGEKELTRLKDMLTKAGDYQMIPEGEQPPEPIEDDKIPITSLPKHPRKKLTKRIDGRKSVSRKSRLDEFNEDEADDVEMKEGDGDESAEKGESMSVDKPDRVFSKRTMKDQFGNYPEWMNKRKMITQKKKNKRIAKNRAASLAGGKRRKFK